jgi:hypothetical protein
VATGHLPNLLLFRCHPPHRCCGERSLVDTGPNADCPLRAETAARESQLGYGCVIAARSGEQVGA